MGAQELGHGTEPSAGAYVVESVHSCSRGCMGAAVFNRAAKVTLEHSTAGKEEAYSWGAFLIRGLEGTKALGLPGRKGGSGAFSGAGNGEGRRDGVRGFKPVAGFQRSWKAEGKTLAPGLCLGGPVEFLEPGLLTGREPEVVPVEGMQGQGGGDGAGSGSEQTGWEGPSWTLPEF